MKATRKTIPILVQRMEPFTNGSGTLKGIVNPAHDDIQKAIAASDLNHAERVRLRIDNDSGGIQYIVVSYETPIAWVTNSGWTYKVKQTFTQTTSKHQGLLYLMPEGFNKEHRKTLDS